MKSVDRSDTIYAVRITNKGTGFALSCYLVPKQVQEFNGSVGRKNASQFIVICGLGNVSNVQCRVWEENDENFFCAERETTTY